MGKGERKAKWRGSSHDRYIQADNGWKITLGRGLDIFEKNEGRFNPAELDQERRRCKGCEVTFLRVG